MYYRCLLRKYSYFYPWIHFSFSYNFLDVAVSLIQSGVTCKCSSENTLRQMRWVWGLNVLFKQSSRLVCLEGCLLLAACRGKKLSRHSKNDKHAWVFSRSSQRPEASCSSASLYTGKHILLTKKHILLTEKHILDSFIAAKAARRRYYFNEELQESRLPEAPSSGPA